MRGNNGCSTDSEKKKKEKKEEKRKTKQHVGKCLTFTKPISFQFSTMIVSAKLLILIPV